MNDSYRDYDEELEDIYDEDEDISDKYIIVQILNSKYGFKIENVKEITVLPECRSTPEMKEYERGIIKLRNDIIKVINLRKRLKYHTIEEEDRNFIKMINELRQDHVVWIDELSASVYEKREARLETDPNKCSFGKWYHNYVADSISLSLYMAQLDNPHRRLHESAKKIIELQQLGRHFETTELLDEVKRNEYKEMMELFDNFHLYLKESRREIIVIFESQGKLVGLTADKVHSIITLPEADIEPPEDSENVDYITGLGKLGEEVYILLDETKLIK